MFIAGRPKTRTCPQGAILPACTSGITSQIPAVVGGETILITGGSGFVGRAVLSEVKRPGRKVRMLTRDPVSANKEWGFLDIEVAKGDVTQSSSLHGACTGVTTVIHLVGIIHEGGGKSFEAVHLEGTRNLLEAAKKAGVKRFIHVSAIGARPHAASRYHRTKWQAEECVRNSGLDWTIFRPSLIFGQGDQFVNLFAKMMRFPQGLPNAFVVPCFGGGKTRFQPVAVEDVARCLVAALENSESVGKIYDLCGLEPLTFTEMMEAIATSMGKKSTKINVSPESLLFALPWAVLTQSKPLLVTFPFQMAYGIGFLAQHLLAKPPLTVEQVQMLEEGSTGNPEPAMKMFSFQPLKFQEGIACYVSRSN